jgi:hypothetical protein
MKSQLFHIAVHFILVRVMDVVEARRSPQG